MASPSVTHVFVNSTAADASAVNTNFTDILNALTDGTKDFSIGVLTCAGTATLNGHVNIGNASADDLTITASLASTIPIKTTGIFNIGSATLGLGTVYFGNGSNSNTVGIVGGVTTTTYALTLPTATGTVGQVMKTNGSGVLSWTDGEYETMPEVSRTAAQREVNYSTDEYVPIVGSGSNMNGHWIRYADGTQICRHNMSSASGSWNSDGAIYQTGNATWTFPVTFVDTSTVVTGSSDSITFFMACENATTSAVIFRIKSGINSAGLPRNNCKVQAIGRWKAL